jgi:hypothetical protein
LTGREIVTALTVGYGSPREERGDDITFSQRISSAARWMERLVRRSSQSEGGSDTHQLQLRR